MVVTIILMMIMTIILMMMMIDDLRRYYDAREHYDNHDCMVDDENVDHDVNVVVVVMLMMFDFFALSDIPGSNCHNLSPIVVMRNILQI